MNHFKVGDRVRYKMPSMHDNILSGVLGIITGEAPGKPYEVMFGDVKPPSYVTTSGREYWLFHADCLEPAKDINILIAKRSKK